LPLSTNIITVENINTEKSHNNEFFMEGAVGCK
jgi:hypothetical protein